MTLKTPETDKGYKFVYFAKYFSVASIIIAIIFFAKTIRTYAIIKDKVTFEEFNYLILSYFIYAFLVIALCFLILILIKVIKESFLNKNKFSLIFEIDKVSNVSFRSKFIRDANIKLNNKKNKFVLIHLDIDKFKIINQMHGHNTGDKILSKIGNVLNENLRDDVYGKEDGDNFLILMKYDGDINKNIKKINNIVNQIENLKVWKKINIKPIVSTGIYIIRNDENIFTAIDNSKIAKENIKGGYKSDIAIYNGLKNSKQFMENRIENDMLDALTNNEFKVYLQPKINLKNGFIIGAEALARWEHPTLGLLQPSKFIPIFERNGFIVMLDKYIFEEVCILLKKWFYEGYNAVPVSVNVSRIQFNEKNFVQDYNEIKDKYEIPDKLIEIEITESVVFNNIENVFAIMRAFKNNGFEISMDDFGSGYSSLGLLRQMPIDTIKLDKVFLNHFDDDNAKIIINDVIKLAKNLKLNVVSEGVETNLQADFLKNVGCDVAQGYTFSKPVPINEFENFIFTKGKKIFDN